MNRPARTSLLILRDGSVVHIERRSEDDARDYRQVANETAERVKHIRTLKFKRQQ